MKFAAVVYILIVIVLLHVSFGTVVSGPASQKSTTKHSDLEMDPDSCSPPNPASVSITAVIPLMLVGPAIRTSGSRCAGSRIDLPQSGLLQRLHLFRI